MTIKNTYFQPSGIWKYMSRIAFHYDIYIYLPFEVFINITANVKHHNCLRKATLIKPPKRDR